MARPGIVECCGGFAEHFEWCEAGQLEAALRRRNVLRSLDHPGYASADALCASYYADMDARDAADREYDRATAHELEASA